MKSSMLALASLNFRNTNGIITITNGRMFYYPEFAAQAVAAGLSTAVVSVNSHDARTHDSLVSVNRLTYLWSVRVLKSGWMKLSSWRN